MERSNRSTPLSPWGTPYRPCDAAKAEGWFTARGILSNCSWRFGLTHAPGAQGRAPGDAHAAVDPSFTQGRPRDYTSCMSTKDDRPRAEMMTSLKSASARAGVGRTG